MALYYYILYNMDKGREIWSDLRYVSSEAWNGINDQVQYDVIPMMLTFNLNDKPLYYYNQKLTAILFPL